MSITKSLNIVGHVMVFLCLAVVTLTSVGCPGIDVAPDPTDVSVPLNAQVDMTSEKVILNSVESDGLGPQQPTFRGVGGPLSASETALYGDLTGDGSVDVVDVQCMNIVVHAEMEGTGLPDCLTDPLAADLNCDGVISVVDFQLVILKAKGDGPLNFAIDADQNGVHDSCEDTSVAESGDIGLYADANGDGAINVVDVTCVRLAVLAEMSDASEAPDCLTHIDAGDLDCDGFYSIVDYQLVLQKALSDGPLNSAIDADENGVHDACE